MDAAAGWDAAERLGATVLAANPTVLRDLLDESRAPGSGTRGVCGSALSGGGPVPPELKLAWRDELGLPLCESYGQCELGGFVGLWAADQPVDRRAGRCRAGSPCPTRRCGSSTTTASRSPPGELGEICLRGGFMAGYWDRPDKTAETLRDGWLHTGDVGFLDAEGFVFMRGRPRERLTVAGEHWYPRDVEEVLMRHPDGVARRRWSASPTDVLGQRPVAFVTADRAQTAHPGSVDVAYVTGPLGRSWCRGRSLTIEVIDAMPMTPTGKISKAAAPRPRGGSTR